MRRRRRSPRCASNEDCDDSNARTVDRRDGMLSVCANAAMMRGAPCTDGSCGILLPNWTIGCVSFASDLDRDGAANNVDADPDGDMIPASRDLDSDGDCVPDRDPRETGAARINPSVPATADEPACETAMQCAQTTGRCVSATTPDASTIDVAAMDASDAGAALDRLDSASSSAGISYGGGACAARRAGRAEDTRRCARR